MSTRPPNSDDSESAAERRIMELADKHLEKLIRGQADLEKMVADHPGLAPELEKRLAVVEKLFSVSRSELYDERETHVDDEYDDRTDAYGGLPIINQRVFRIHCPHCGINIQLVDELESGEVTCRGCGSTIEVDPKATRSRARSIGQQIQRFQIVSLVGQGGFGSVYKAHDPNLGRTVALKIPRIGFFETKNQHARFLREAKNAARLRHPNIVQVHEILENEQYPVIVNQFIDGLTLGDLISSQRLEIREGVKLVATVAEAIEYAHSQGVVHRDIKPSNILLDANRNPYVADFGLAHDTHAAVTMTIDGEILGTPAYMSPEQARGESSRVDKRLDVYSLGVVLYQLLSGELPFRGSKRMLLHQVIHEDPKSVRRLNDSVPRDLEVIVAKAMQKEPSRRYSSAKALSDDLNRWLNFEPILARPEGLLNRVAKWYRRKPAVASLATCVALLVAAGLIASILWARTVSDFNRTLGDQLAVSDARLEKLYLQNGLGLLRSNELKSLPWFEKLLPTAMALEPESESDPQDQIHRLRMKLMLDRAPKLTNLWAIGKGARFAEYSRDGRLILAINRQNTAYLIDTLDGSIKHQLSHSAPVQNIGLDSTGTLILVTSGNMAHVWNATTGELQFRLAHDDVVMFAEFSGDSKQIVTASLDGTAKVWSSSDGQLVQSLEHPKPVRSAMFSPDQKTIATVAFDDSYENSSIRIWNLETAVVEHSFLHPQRVSAAAFAQSGQWLVSCGDDRTARIWDLQSGQASSDPIQMNEELSQIQFEREGGHFHLVSTNGSVSRWDVASGKPAGPEFGEPAASVGAALSPDSVFAALAGADGSVRLHWAKSGSSVCGRIPAGSMATVVAFHPNGRKLVTAGNDGVLKEWDLAGLNSEFEMLPHQDKVLEAVFSQMGDRILSCGHDSTARLWNAVNGLPLSEPMKHESPVLECAFADRDRVVITAGGDKTTRIWDGFNGQPIGQPIPHTDVAIRVDANPKDNTFATGTMAGNVFVWQLGAETPQFSVNHETSLRDVTFSSDGEKLATASLEGVVKLWNARDGSRLGPELKHDGSVTFCEFDPDGTLLATSGGNYATTVWALDDLSRPWQVLPHEGDVTSCTFGNGGQRLLTTDLNGNVVMWERSNGQFEQLWKWASGNYGFMFGSISSDDQLVAVCGKKFRGDDLKPGNGVTFLLDARTGTAVSPPLEHLGLVRRARFSNDGKRLLTASSDYTARIWSLESDLTDSDALADLISVITGTSIDEQMQLNPLDASEQQRRFDRLSNLHPELVRCSSTQIERWQKYVQWVTETTGPAKSDN